MKFGFSISLSRNKEKRLTRKSGMTIAAPFTENVESGMPYIISGTDLRDILSTLRGSYTDRSLIELFGTVAEIFAPIDAIASRAVNAKFKFRKKSTGLPVEGNEALNKLITSPNPFQNFKQFIYELICYELCTGKNYVYLNIPETLQKDYKNMAAVFNLPSDRIHIDIPERIKLFSATKVEDVIKRYVLDKGSRDETTFSSDKVIYRKRVNLNWNAKKIEGRSPLLSAEMAIANLIAVYKARGTIYLKRGAMGMWVSKKSDASGNVSLTKDEKKSIREQLDKDYGVVGKDKHTIGLTEAPVEFVKSSMSIQELQPFEETSADAAAIYGVLGVPYELAPKPKGETFSNQNTAERSLYQNNVMPLVNSICDSLTTGWGINEWDYELYADFNHMEVLQSNADTDKTRIESYTKLYKDGGITYNEWLVRLGYMPRGKEFDKYIVDIETIPMAVKIGVGGTQAMQSVVADPNLSEDAKANLLVLLFGITIEQARVVVVTTPKTESNA
jgi:HK97 family phage portal protein